MPIDKAVIGSLIRWIVAFLLGMFGVSVTAEWTNQFVGWAVAGVGLAVSLWFSIKSRRRGG